MENKSEPKIYVACLAAYNNGILHGRWIDANQDADTIRDEIAADSEVIAPTIPRNSRPGFRADPAHRSD